MIACFSPNDSSLVFITVADNSHLCRRLHGGGGKKKSKYESERRRQYFFLEITLLSVTSCKCVLVINWSCLRRALCVFRISIPSFVLPLMASGWHLREPGGGQFRSAPQVGSGWVVLIILVFPSHAANHFASFLFNKHPSPSPLGGQIQLWQLFGEQLNKAQHQQSLVGTFP